jgi:hypothetical protein
LIENRTIYGILEEELKKIYSDRILKLEILNLMPYPMRDHLFVVRYNIDLKDEVPIRRAQIVVDLNARELKKFEPSLL